MSMKSELERMVVYHLVEICIEPYEPLVLLVSEIEKLAEVCSESLKKHGTDLGTYSPYVTELALHLRRVVKMPMALALNLARTVAGSASLLLEMDKESPAK